MFRLRTLAALTLIAATNLGSRTLPAQTIDTIDPALKSRINAIAAGVMEQRGVPSASIAVIQHGKLVFTHAYGLAHINPDKPATPEMRYSIGSISKQFTASAILILQEQGKLSMRDPVARYFPQLTRARDITLLDLGGHVSLRRRPEHEALPRHLEDLAGPAPAEGRRRRQRRQRALDRARHDRRLARGRVRERDELAARAR